MIMARKNGTTTIPNFLLEQLSRTTAPPDTPIGGAISLVGLSATLLFPENGASRVDLRVQTRYLVNETTRFVLKYSKWSGRGVQGYPWIHARLNGSRLPARVQGEPFWADDRRCFIVDLGQEIQPGQRFDLVTQSLYVDEAGTFDPYLASRVERASELETIRISVAFKSPPDLVHFGKLEFGTHDFIDAVVLRPVSRYGYAAFEYVKDSDISAGHYCLYWQAGRA